jgi:hypothetical protein
MSTLGQIICLVPQQPLHPSDPTARARQVPGIEQAEDQPEGTSHSTGPVPRLQV